MARPAIVALTALFALAGCGDNSSLRAQPPGARSPSTRQTKGERDAAAERDATIDGGARVVGDSCSDAGLACMDDQTPVSCCDTKWVPGGTFPMGRCDPNTEGCTDTAFRSNAEIPEHTATVAGFYLDTFEVTVGRFRRFVAAYGLGWRPSTRQGEHPLARPSGWSSGWTPLLPADQSALLVDLRCSQYATWTDTAADTEQLPVNCVSWYVAFAFCAWDAGRLPTEAEWEYAAAGGSENRQYPWGTNDGGEAWNRAVHNCLGSGFADESTETSLSSACTFADILSVGSRPLGRARYGQHDLAGSMWEWALDRFEPYEEAPCTNCVNLPTGVTRVMRGGSWKDFLHEAPAAHRRHDAPDQRNDSIGFRCARDTAEGRAREQKNDL